MFDQLSGPRALAVHNRRGPKTKASGAIAGKQDPLPVGGPDGRDVIGWMLNQWNLATSVAREQKDVAGGRVFVPPKIITDLPALRRPSHSPRVPQVERLEYPRGTIREG